jgi:CDP-4-dehydro-6-deoxyglucose reductase, E3
MPEHRIVIDNAGIAFVATSEEIILDSALRQGIRLPHQCRGAQCGTCKAKILEGEVDHGWNFGLALTDEEKASGHCLLCQSRALTPRLVVRTLNAVEGVRPEDQVHEIEATVSQLSDETPNVRKVVLMQPKDTVFVYRAGMYAEFVLPGIAPNRCYSFATAQGKSSGGFLTFYVSRHPRGQASGHVHDELQVGSKLVLRGPFGTFGLPQDSTGPVLALAGGTGIAPILAVAEDAFARGGEMAFALLFSVRDRDELFALDRLGELRGRAPNFSHCVSYTRARADGIATLAGRLPGLLPKLYPGLSKYRVLAAGSPGFVEDCVNAAIILGAVRERICFDKFTAAAA